MKSTYRRLRAKGDLGSHLYSWEQRKLGEISDKVTEKNIGLQYVETFTNSAELHSYFSLGVVPWVSLVDIQAGLVGVG